MILRAVPLIALSLFATTHATADEWRLGLAIGSTRLISPTYAYWPDPSWGIEIYGMALGEFGLFGTAVAWRPDSGRSRHAIRLGATSFFMQRQRRMVILEVGVDTRLGDGNRYGFLYGLAMRRRAVTTATEEEPRWSGWELRPWPVLDIGIRDFSDG